MNHLYIFSGVWELFSFSILIYSIIKINKYKHNNELYNNSLQDFISEYEFFEIYDVIKYTQDHNNYEFYVSLFYDSLICICLPIFSILSVKNDTTEQESNNENI
jgi:hypothetical protein